MDGVDSIQAGDWSAHGELIFRALLEGAHSAPQVVEVCIANRAATRWAVAAKDAAEGEVSVSFVRSDLVELDACVLAANDDLVLAA